MAACLNCGRFVYQDVFVMDKLVFCSVECEKKHNIKSIPLNIPCHICHKEIIISEGFVVKGKNVFCSTSCFNQFNTNHKKQQHE